MAEAFIISIFIYKSKKQRPEDRTDAFPSDESIG